MLPGSSRRLTRARLPLTYVLAGVLTTLVFLASLLAHELAHSLVARITGWFPAGAATTEAQQAVLAGCNLTI